jgi:hypothetical protein
MSVFPVDGTAAVRVDIQMGRIDVVATARDDVSVTVSPSNPRRSGDRSAAENVKVNRAGDRVVVAGPFRLTLFGAGDSVDVLVEVPEGSLVDAVLKYGSAHLAGRLGGVRVDLAYGDLTVDAAERVELKGGHGDFRVGLVIGDADVSFKSGSVRLGRVDGALRLTGADGPVVVDAVAGRAEVATSSGSVELGVVGDGATIRSAYGAVRVRHAIRGVVQVDGSYGDVGVGVRRGTPVWLDATSRHGVVRTDLASDPGPADGDETLELRIRTGYGSITVHRSDAPTP